MSVKLAAVIALLVAALVACLIVIVVGISDDTIKFALVAVLLAIVGVFAVRFSVSFDLNKYLEEQREKRKRNAQALCPHADVVSVDVEDSGGFRVEIRGGYSSPPGTFQYQCEMCGNVTSEERASDSFRRWQGNLTGLMDQLKRFRAAVKKIDG